MRGLSKFGAFYFIRAPPYDWYVGDVALVLGLFSPPRAREYFPRAVPNPSSISSVRPLIILTSVTSYLLRLSTHETLQIYSDFA